MRHLIMTVGTGRDRQDIAQGLLFSIKWHTPDTVVLLCSEKTAAETLPLLEDSLRRESIAYESKTLANEDDVQSLYNDYLSILQSLGRPEDLVVDFTSGTKAMSAALFAAAVAVQAGQVSYITGPRDETGRVIESTGVEAFYPAQVYAERQVERAKLLFNNLDFVAAKEMTDSLRRTLPQDGLLARWAKTIYILSQVYDLWERFRWKEAGHLLKKAVSPQERLIGVEIEQLNHNLVFLNAVSLNPNGDERLVELLLNTQRRCQQGHFDDALSRMYRAYEHLTQNILLNQYKIDTSRSKLSDYAAYNLSDNLKKKLEDKSRNYGGAVKLGLREGLELLAELGHEVGQELYRLYWGRSFEAGFVPDYKRHSGLLMGWLNQRNDSFLAHGSKPAEEQTVKGLVHEYKALLKRCLTAEQLEKLQSMARFATL